MAQGVRETLLLDELQMAILDEMHPHYTWLAFQDFPYAFARQCVKTMPCHHIMLDIEEDKITEVRLDPKLAQKIQVDFEELLTQLHQGRVGLSSWKNRYDSDPHRTRPKLYNTPNGKSKAHR
jgi:hypothetical protein